MSTRTKRLLALAGIACVATLAFAPAAHALGVKGGDEIVIGSGEIYDDDLVLSATTVTVNGTVNGDLIVFARDVRINGVVTGDLMGAAQSVTVNGEVRDDVRVAGAVVTFGTQARVTDDVLAAGGSFETQPGSMVGGDLLLGASRALLAGAVAGDLFLGGERASILGSVAGNVMADLDSSVETDGLQPWMFQSSMPTMPPWVNVPAGLVIGQNAKIGGKLDYTSPQAASIPTGVVNDVRHTPKIVITTAVEETAAPQSTGLTGWLLTQLRSYVSLALVALLLLWLAPKLLPRTADMLSGKPGPSLGWGFIGAIVVPAGALLLLIVAIMLAVLFGTLTLGGLSGSIVLITLAALFSALVLFGLAIAYASKLIVAYWLARVTVGRAWHLHPIVLVLIGLLPVVLLSAAPYVGGLLTLAIVFFTLGALWLTWREARDHALPLSMPPPPVQTPDLSGPSGAGSATPRAA